MADVTPNYDLETKRLELEVAQLQLNIQSQGFRVLQIEDEKQRLQENITATKESIKELQDTILKLSKEN